MKIKVRDWKQLTHDERMKMLEIASQQNWMGRW